MDTVYGKRDADLFRCIARPNWTIWSEI